MSSTKLRNFLLVLSCAVLVGYMVFESRPQSAAGDGVPPKVLCERFCTDLGGALVTMGSGSVCYCSHPNGYNFNQSVQSVRQQFSEGQHGDNK